jgi:hypothetical protein
MRHAILAGIAAAALLAAPVLAQDRSGINLAKAEPGVRGGVAMLALAQDLYGVGLAQNEALTVLAAGRLVQSVLLHSVEQKKTTEGAGSAAQVSGLPMDAGAVFAAARELAGEDETVIGLIEAAEVEGAFGPVGVARVTPSLLPAGAVDTWEIPLFGGSYAELAVLGDGGADLDVRVTDENGNTVCMDVSWSDRVYCDFTPEWNGYFLVRVENVGDRDNSYHLLTN